MRKNFFVTALATTALLMVSSQSRAVVVGTDDFEAPGDPNGVSTANFLSRVTVPDNSGNLGFGGAPGVFSSFFDLFGYTNRNVLFDVADDSAGSFPPDNFGIIPTSKTDSFFGITDLENGDNPGGTGSITWKFDVSGHQNLSVSLDLAAIGNFDTTDDFLITGQLLDPNDVPVGPVQTLYNIQHASGIQYEVEMEAFDPNTNPGAKYDRYNTDFYDQVLFDQFCPAGPGVGNCTAVTGVFDGNPGSNDPHDIDFHSLDFDMDGLVELQDGSLERAYEDTNPFGTFDETEHELYIDPLAVNAQLGDFDFNGEVNGEDFLLFQLGETTSPLIEWEFNYGASGPVPVLLDNNLQTVTVPVSGTGARLQLIFLAAQNSSKEVFVMDNLSIEGDVIPPISTVPEPATVALFGLGLVLAPMLRRRRS